MRIGILTGGGDVPGLNPCIKAVVNRAEDGGMEAIGRTPSLQEQASQCQKYK